MSATIRISPLLRSFRHELRVWQRNNQLIHSHRALESSRTSLSRYQRRAITYTSIRRSEEPAKVEDSEASAESSTVVPQEASTTDIKQDEGVETVEVDPESEVSNDNVLNLSERATTDESLSNTSLEPSPDTATIKNTEPENLTPAEREKLRADRLRSAMRRIPNPIVLITASTASRSDGPNNFDHSYGVTISSFNTVSIGQPGLPSIVSFNLRKPSRTYDAIAQTKLFRVSLLRSCKRGRSIAKTFLDHQHAAAFQALRESKVLPIKRIKPYPVFGRQQTNLSIDQLTDETVLVNHQFRHESLIASMACQVLEDKCVQVADHVIVVAKVLDCSPIVKTNQESGATGLIYYDGEFGHAQRLPSVEEVEVDKSQKKKNKNKSKKISGVSKSTRNATNPVTSNNTPKTPESVTENEHTVIIRRVAVQSNSVRRVRSKTAKEKFQKAAAEGVAQPEDIIQKKDSKESVVETTAANDAFPTFFIDDKVVQIPVKRTKNGEE